MKGPKVLLLEEDPTFASELQTGLRGLGCEVVLLRDGRTGLARAVSDRFDVILLSAELPHMNGFRLCNRIKKDANAKKVPLFLMGTTASAEFEAHQRLPTRAESYFQKPVVFAELVARMRLHQVLEPAPPSALGEKLAAQLEAAREGATAIEALRRKLADQEAETSRLERELAQARAQLAKTPPKPPPPLPSKELTELRQKLAAETSARVDLNEKLIAGSEALRRLEAENAERAEALERAEKRIVLLERACAEQVPALQKARADAAANEIAFQDKQAAWEEEKQKLVAEAAFAKIDGASAIAKAKSEVKKATEDLEAAIKGRDAATAALEAAKQARHDAEVEREAVLVDLVSTRRAQKTAEERTKELSEKLTAVRLQTDAELARITAELDALRGERDAVAERIAAAIAETEAKGREELADFVERAGEVHGLVTSALKAEHAAALEILAAEREGAIKGERRRAAEKEADARAELARVTKELQHEIASAKERAKIDVERSQRLAADAKRAASEAEARYERLAKEREAEKRSAVPVLETIEHFSEEAALKIAMLETERTDELAAREAAHAKEVADLQAARDRAVSELRATNETVRRSAAEFRKQAHDLEVKLAGVEQAHAAKVARFEQDLAEAKAQATRESASELARANADAARLAASVEEMKRATKALSAELTEVRSQLKSQTEKLTADKRAIEERATRAEAALRAAEADEATRRTEIATLRRDHERGVEKLMLRLTEADTAVVEARALLSAEVERRAELEASLEKTEREKQDAQRESEAARRTALGLRRALDAEYKRTLDERIAKLEGEHAKALEEERAQRTKAIAEVRGAASTKASELEASLKKLREEAAAQAKAQAEAIERLEKELAEAQAEVPELEAEIVVLRGELMSVRRQLEQETVAARAAQTQLDQNRELLAEAKKLLDKITAPKT